MSQRPARSNVPVKMFRFLILAQIRYHSTLTVVFDNPGRNLANDSHHFKQETTVLLSESKQRADVAFRNHDHMDGIKGTRMVESEYLRCLDNCFDRGEPA